MPEKEGDQGEGSTEATGSGDPKDSPTQQGGEGFVPKERYDELLRQKDVLEATQRTLVEDQERRDQVSRASQGAASADEFVQAYARQQGITVEEAQRWLDTTTPIVEARLNQVIGQYIPVLSGIADKIAVMELEANPDYGELYRENKADVTRIRNEAAKAGQYLAPETALHMVVARKMIQERKTKEQEEETSNSGVTARASTASKSNLRNVRPSNPRDAPVTHADIAKMTREDRSRLLEESADRGETF
jgi:hypothetical protein